jgi:hypothetical protein
MINYICIQHLFVSHIRLKTKINILIDLGLVRLTLHVQSIVEIH